MKLKLKLAVFSALAVLVSMQSLLARSAAGAYGLKAQYALPGDGGWDYLTYDPSSNRLFIARGTRVQVVNPDTGQVQAEIADTPGVHGVAIAGELGKGYTSNGRENTISVFDLKSLQVKTKVGTTGGENPDFIAYDAFAKRVFAFNGRTHNASVIDATTDRLAATIALHGKPEAAVADGSGKLFVNIEDTNELSVIDTVIGKVVSTWALRGCDEPAGLAMDLAGRRLFVGCHNRAMLVVNADTGAIVTSLPIGEGVDANAFDTETRQIFSSQWDGTLTIALSGGDDRFSVEQTARTQQGARTMALNPKTHEVYLVTADFKEAPQIDGQPRGRPVMVPGSFRLLIMSPKAP